MVDELLEYLDGELPKANEQDVEQILDQAAPVLAALLVPMKQKYDRIVEIKEEVTEAITEVVPVEELVQDYEETLDDLKDFCKHISEEVGVNWQENMDELHRKLWELESSMSEIEDASLSSFDNVNPCPARFRRQVSEVESDKLSESPDLKLKLQISVEDDTTSSKICEHKFGLDTLSTKPFTTELISLSPPERYQSPTQVSAGSSPATNILVTNIESLPNIEISSETQASPQISPASSRSLSPIHLLHSQYSFGSIATSDRAQSPSVFYSACHSRRQSLGSHDLISRYVSQRHPQLFDSDQFKDFASRRSSLNQTLYDLSHCESHSTRNSISKRYLTKRQSALSILVDYVKYRIGLEKISENTSSPVLEVSSPVLEVAEAGERVKIRITPSSVSSEL